MRLPTGLPSGPPGPDLGFVVRVEFGTICSEIVADLGGRDQAVDVALAVLALGAAVVLKLAVVAPVEAQVANLGQSQPDVRISLFPNLPGPRNPTRNRNRDLDYEYE